MADIKEFLNDPKLADRIQAIIENSSTPQEASKAIEKQEIEKLWQYWPDECPYDCDHCND